VRRVSVHRDNSSRIDIGAVSAVSITKLNNTLFWLGRDMHGGVQAYLLAGYQPQRISTAAEEQLWQSYSNRCGRLRLELSRRGASVLSGVLSDAWNVFCLRCQRGTLASKSIDDSGC
jgi:hypothetical protein